MEWVWTWGGESFVKLLILALLISSSTAVRSETDHDSGNSLLAECSEAIRAVDGDGVYDVNALTCAAYISGFSHALLAAQTTRKWACLPDDATVGQLTRIVVKYLNNNLEKLHDGKALLVMNALANAFPCDNQSAQ